MIMKDIPKHSAELYKSLLSELKPSWKVEIILEDYNLYKLGFTDDIPCYLSLDVFEEDINELYDEIIEMEIYAYMDEDLLYKNPRSMSKEEKSRYREAKERKKEYDKYASLIEVCDYNESLNY